MAVENIILSAALSFFCHLPAVFFELYSTRVAHFVSRQSDFHEKDEIHEKGRYSSTSVQSRCDWVGGRCSRPARPLVSATLGSDDAGDLTVGHSGGVRDPRPARVGRPAGSETRAERASGIPAGSETRAERAAKGCH
jgi:hypothetical protein